MRLSRGLTHGNESHQRAVVDTPDAAESPNLGPYLVQGGGGAAAAAHHGPGGGARRGEVYDLIVDSPADDDGEHHDGAGACGGGGRARGQRQQQQGRQQRRYLDDNEDEEVGLAAAYYGEDLDEYEVDSGSYDDEGEEGGSVVDNDVCASCGGHGELVLCDGCEAGFHLACVGLRSVPEGEWLCPHCDD